MSARHSYPLEHSRAHLPQEIINLIVDQIASDYPEDTSLLKTLQACAVASSSLRIASRKHAFSHITLLANRFTQRRAKRLFKLLDAKGNPGSPILHVQSLELVVEPLRIPPGIMVAAHHTYYHSWQDEAEEKLRLLAGRLRFWENYLLKVLDLFADSSTLERLIITSKDAGLSWPCVNDAIRSALYRIRCNPSFKSLCLEFILHMDRSFIAGKESTGRLCELALRNVNVRNEIPIPVLTTPLDGLQRIERLDLFCGPDFLSLFPPTSHFPLSGVTTQTLPKLDTLAISLYGGNANPNVLWRSICSFSSTLQNLEVRDIFFSDTQNFPNPYYNSATLVCLNDLPSLKHLSFTTPRFFFGNPNSIHLHAAAQLLKSATAPLPLTSISFDIEVAPRLQPGKERRPFFYFLQVDGSTVLDQALTCPWLVNMQRINIKLTMILCRSRDLIWRSNEPDNIYSPIDEAYIRGLFPLSSSLASVRFDVSVKTIYRVI